jgi:hypothetical protein
MRLLLIVSAVVAIACVSTVEPTRETCFFPGDTAEVHPVVLATDSLIVACQWGVVQERHCFTVPVTRYTRTDCVEGTKWKG